MTKSSNSAGNTNRDIRKFLREQGVKANAANVELIGREVRRTEAQNEQMDRIGREIARETGHSGLVNRQGQDAGKAARERTKRALSARERQERIRRERGR
jgi:hypothetical protein